MKPTQIPEHPIVSIVIPMMDEREAIGACLESFEAQTYPAERLDVVVVDGGSSDGSREIVEAWAEKREWLRVADNPKRKAAAAFNVGLSLAKGDLVGLFSAHGVANPNFVERSVVALRETGAAGVGGRYEHVGQDGHGRAIGLAMASPFGMASPHRIARRRCSVDTISHPVYVAAAAAAIGPFDESLDRNSDYDFNWRLRDAGYTLVFDPSVSSIYRPRPTLGALARQFWWYGRGKARVAFMHPRSVRPRHVVAPLAVAGTVASPLLARTRRGRRLLGLAAGAYGGLVLGAMVAARPAQHGACSRTLAAAFPVMHGAWGAGFLAALPRLLKERRTS